MNGLIPLDNDNRVDRNIAYYRSVELLEKGGNLLIFPESADELTTQLREKGFMTKSFVIKSMAFQPIFQLVNKNEFTKDACVRLFS